MEELHGHVKPRPDGNRARCGGPGMCKVCSQELAAYRIEQKTRLNRKVLDALRPFAAWHMIDSDTQAQMLNAIASATEGDTHA